MCAAEAGPPNGLECARKRLLISSKAIRREENEEGNDGGGGVIRAKIGAH